MHRLFDDGETRDELVVRRHHPLVRHAFGASGLDHLWEGLKNVIAVAGWFYPRLVRCRLNEGNREEVCFLYAC